MSCSKNLHWIRYSWSTLTLSPFPMESGEKPDLRWSWKRLIMITLRRKSNFKRNTLDAKGSKITSQFLASLGGWPNKKECTWFWRSPRNSSKVPKDRSKSLWEDLPTWGKNIARTVHIRCKGLGIFTPEIFGPIRLPSLWTARWWTLAVTLRWCPQCLSLGA